VDRLLDSARLGQSGALVVRGDAGVGKSALLRYALTTASGFQVIRASGVESEMELAYAGLLQLCKPLLDRLEGLPVPQQEALGTAFGLSSGAPPDRFLVGLGVLGLLSDAARERPLLCVVDDAHWLDRVSAQVLAFVARRVEMESVALLFGTRGSGEQDDLAPLPEIVLGGLSDADARLLLLSRITGRLDERILDRLVAEAQGNPLALLELPRGLTPAQLAGGFGLPAAQALSDRLEESFRRRLEALPPDTQRLLLVAAAEPMGDPALLWRAAARLGISPAAAAPAVDAALAEFGARVHFRHPLVRSAVYRAAAPEARRAAHAALAEATEPQVDPDRRAWHRAEATFAPDEDVAAELERSADRARARGGPAAAAVFLERAAALTVDPLRRSERALAAAQAKHQAGAPDAALALLATAEVGPLDELARAHGHLLRGQVAYVNRGRDAPGLLLEAAKRLEPRDAALALETYLDAILAFQFLDRLAVGASATEVAEAARAGRRLGASLHRRAIPDLLLDGFAALVLDGYAEAAPSLKRALAAFRAGNLATATELRWAWAAAYVAFVMWDDDWVELCMRWIQLARDAGALGVLPIALSHGSVASVMAGELARAGARLDELETITEAIGSPIPPYGRIALAAWQGWESEAGRLSAAGKQEAADRGEGLFLPFADWARAVLYNGLGRYEAALEAAQHASEEPLQGQAGGLAMWGLVELVEAAARTGSRQRAAGALEQLAERTGASGSEWALGIQARSRALLAEGSRAEALYRESIDRLRRGEIGGYLARSHLVYGEWLRRERRRVDAREQLRSAYELCTEMRLDAFADRARRELLATGATAQKRHLTTRVELTAQEAQIARLARDGLSNPEIGSRLFISSRTVEYHLHKVFTKLAISSRTQLDAALPRETREAQPI
jgi:DNA-binding CsgD family transcriptional regulator